MGEVHGRDKGFKSFNMKGGASLVGNLDTAEAALDSLRPSCICNGVNDRINKKLTGVRLKKIKIK